MGFEERIDQRTLEGAKYTVQEIAQQPRLWRETVNLISKRRIELQKFMEVNVFEKNSRLIFTGAGTSAYVGDMVSPLLRKVLSNQVDSIATTDIVTNPLNYLKPEVPTVLISFARSGNSPESVGAYHLAKKLIKNLRQIIITCNKEGQLAKEATNDPDSLLLLMPEESNDMAFAMTSSFSCMYLSTLLLFKLDEWEDYTKKIEVAARNAEWIIKDDYDAVSDLVDLNKKKLVYLGSSALKGLAQETCLKHQELTAGKFPSFYESILGFRHGPKSVVDDETLIFVFISNDSYTRKYEIDLLKELKKDGGQKIVVAIANKLDEDLFEHCDRLLTIPVDEKIDLEDDLLAIDYVLYGQLFALFNSIHHGITPDNPSPSGLVNRVVKGVQLYTFNYLTPDNHSKFVQPI